MRLIVRSLCLLGAVLGATTSIRAQSGGMTVTGANAPVHLRFRFGSATATAPFVGVTPEVVFNSERGYGFEPDSNLPAPGVAPMPATAPAIEGIRRDGVEPGRATLVTGKGAFIFSAAVPEGNYKVTLTLGDAAEESTTTVKAEARRLMLERVHTGKGEFVTRQFTVNVRRPQFAGGEVKLDPREPGSFTWDDKLSLQFSDARPALVAMEIEKVDDAVTVFLCGDSTVTDQPREPYGTWGQMLPRFFKPEVAVANYAESGETLKAFRFERRWDKVMSLVRPGDYVCLQFGHNDLNKTGRNAMWPAEEPSGDWSKTYSEAATDYKALLKEYVAAIKAKGATPVIVSPMTKIDIRSGELNSAGLRDYPAAAVEAAKEAGVALIDLNAMSVEVAKELGTDLARRAYVDGLHTNSYGGYLLARCVVEGVRQSNLGLARWLVEDAGSFDPAHPQPLPDAFGVPLEPSGRPVRPPGARGRGGAASAPASSPATPSVPRN